MIINGREYKFNRIVKVEFLNSQSEVDYVIEFNPVKDRALCAHIDAEVLGLPQPVKSNSPGFSASVTFYNPPKELLSHIALQTRFISDFVRDENYSSDLIVNDMSGWQVPMVLPEEVQDRITNIVELRKGTSASTDKVVSDTLVRYYSNRSRVRLSAGYYDKKTDTEHYEHLFTGYLNGSAFWHKGTDNILQVNCHDIDLSNIEPGTILTSIDPKTRAALERTVITQSDQRRMGKETFDQTVRNFIQYFAPEEIRDGKLHRRLSVESKMTSFDVWYVKSRQEVRRGLKNGEGFNKSWEYPRLKTLLTSTQKQQPMAPNLKHYYTTKATLREMLTDVCSTVFLARQDGGTMSISWDLIQENVSRSTYIFFPIGDDPKTVPASGATFRIWNYQNLLEAPSVDGAGQLTVKMLLRPEIRTMDSIALMLSPDLGVDEGLVPIGSFESSIHYGTNRLLGTLGTTANLRTTPTVQLSEAASVSSLRKKTADAKFGGYMFNYGFIISRFEHKISTHNSDWSTTVKTVPMYGGTRV